MPYSYGGNWMNPGESSNDADRRASQEFNARQQLIENERIAAEAEKARNSAKGLPSSYSGGAIYETSLLGRVVQLAGLSFIICAWFVPSVIVYLFGREDFSEISITLTGIALVLAPQLHQVIKIVGTGIGAFILYSGGYVKGGSSETLWDVASIPQEVWVLGLGLIIGSILFGQLLVKKV